ncbi:MULTISPECIES: uberolysin/carnocyclin family circular bacteriocin [Bacillus]|uniref:Circularin A/uberolysin family circular bacteriocin n=2 Tax=Bacillus TaxID=1386 RepID=A0A0M4FWL5_9BACI|nr:MULTISPECIES: uberolysin/carnocyclin family circular bacteriocin [Bacillus]ALC83218.1 circularin A/uberolysin family circular bacteriocin [Bacillus gobiensis]MBP1084216.1 circularin A/uberolysin family circular bacteriocin [Bacillus capparidis]MED1094668.1 uberolysin/carnocyclin family circular bacteriocin [Bacillus capparidis]
MSLPVQRKALNYGFLLAVGLILLGAYALLLGFLPEMNIVKEFKLSYVAASQIFVWLDVISWGVSLLALIAALGTGGSSLIAAAGSMGVKKYLKDMAEEKGKDAAIAY